MRSVTSKNIGRRAFQNKAAELLEGVAQRRNRTSLLALICALSPIASR